MTRRSRRSKSKKGERKRSRFTKFRSVVIHPNMNNSIDEYTIIFDGKTYFFDSADLELYSRVNGKKVQGPKLTKHQISVIEDKIKKLAYKHPYGPMV